MNPSPDRIFVSGVFAAASTVISGSALVAMRLASEHADALSLGLIRNEIGVLSLVPFVLLCRCWPKPRELAIIVAIGSITAGLSPWLLIQGMALTTASMGGLILSTTPFLTYIVAMLFRQEAFSISRCIGGIVVSAGVLTVIGRANEPVASLGFNLHPVGLGMVFVSAIISALYNVGSRNVLHVKDPFVLTFGLLMGGLLATALIALLSGATLSPSLLPKSALEPITLCGSVAGLQALLWLFALKYAAAGRVAPYLTLMPLSAAALDAMVLNEPLRPELLLAVGLVTIGSLLMAWQGQSRPFESSGGRLRQGASRDAV